jgi:hypothetical protein
VPASDTGAVEMALCRCLTRGVTVLAGKLQQRMGRDVA